MKNLAVFISTFMFLILSGCQTLKGLGSDEIVVKNVSVEDGITVVVKRVECTFGFTNDRKVIRDEIRRCLLDNTVPILAATTVTSISTTKEIPRTEVPPEVGKDAKKATDAVVSELKK